MNSRKSVIIIGARLGGVATAAYQARSGYEVTVLDKKSAFGGLRA